MKQKSLQVALCLLLCLLAYFTATQAQQQVITVTPGQQALPIPVVSPDQKAYEDARRVKDPQKKIEALEKVIKDFPNRFFASQARFDILDILIKSFPDQKDRIHAAAQKILEPSEGIVVSGSYNYISVANKLVEAGIFLDWAEELAKKGSAMYEDETAKSLRRQRARYQDTLGRIYLKQGKTKEAKRYLKQALDNEPE